ncbi:DNA polymerase III subunit chi [Oceanobacter mangrovi]|uniref:DNA polymerase III subunit chi n=1 Tax=Oceanobacter mangrovi TaxID=2862510 RepID=UPI001C8EC20E|nr:DNA polymerase III subunit chi [Oceanobacter mangrovi]
MTDVWFYVLAATTVPEQLKFVCRLTEKIQAQGKHTYIHVDDAAIASELDEMLWNFRPNAFVPHQLVAETPASEQCPVHIGWQDVPVNHHDVMINLSQQLPGFFARFERLVEVVIQEDNVLDCTRNHYRFLRDRGYDISHQDMRLRT